MGERASTRDGREARLRFAGRPPARTPLRHRRRVALSLALALALAALPLGAASPPSSWQRQTLLAATAEAYLVLEAEGYKPGSVDVWTETLRLVRFDARTNERVGADIVRAETWSETGAGERLSDVTRSSDASLGATLDAFGGQLAPPPAIRLKRDFHVDEAGIYVNEGPRRVTILTREEIDARVVREPHGDVFERLEVTALQQIGEQFFITLRGGAARVRRELVLRIPR